MEPIPGVQRNATETERRRRERGRETPLWPRALPPPRLAAAAAAHVARGRVRNALSARRVARPLPSHRARATRESATTRLWPPWTADAIRVALAFALIAAALAV